MPIEGLTQAFAIFLAGVLQPFIQEALVRNRVNDIQAQVVTWVISGVLTVIAIWATGGFAPSVFSPPPFSLADPSGFLAYVAARYTPIRAVAWVVFKYFRPAVQSFAETKVAEPAIP
jgi:hypothetical protein